MMRHIIAPILMLGLALGSYAAAPALPGQQLPAWLAWAKANPMLQHLAKDRAELSGQTYYSKTIVTGGVTYYFSALLGDASNANLISQETLAMQNLPTSYDLGVHRATAAKMAGLIYGAAGAADVLAAVPAGSFAIYDNPQRVTFLKGKLYAYQLGGPALQVFQKSGLAAALKNAKFCATHQCGD